MDSAIDEDNGGPLLMFSNADCQVLLSRRLFEASGHPDKEMQEIPWANHYYAGPDGCSL